MKDELAPLDWRAVLFGGTVCAVIALPSLLVGAAVSDEEGSNLAVVALILILFLAPFLGGAVAARDKRATPFTHGAAAAALGWLVLVIHAVVRVALGHHISPGYLVVTGIVNVSMGMLGGYTEFRRELRKEASDQSPGG